MATPEGLLVLAALGGLAVLTRYDAVLFAGPVLLAALVQASQSWKNETDGCGACGRAAVSSGSCTHGCTTVQCCPTSFYIKTPTAELDVVAVNLRYMAEHLLIGGIGVMAVYAIARVASGGRVGRTVGEELRAHWGLHAGLLAGARLRRQHGDRAHDVRVPSFHAVSRRDGTGAGASRPAGRRCTTARALVPRLVRGGRRRAADSARSTPLHAEAMYRRSLQGLGTFGEYGEQGAAGYARDYIPAMMKNAADIKAHWSALGKGREPRIWTFAAGALPYAYREAYIFEALVSFRHRLSAGGGWQPT